MPQAEMGEGLIDRDVRCIKCKYNLRTLDQGGKCPECGLEVFTSIESHERHEARRLRLKRRVRMVSLWVRKLLFGPFCHRRPIQAEMPFKMTQSGWRREMSEAATLMLIALLWPVGGVLLSRLMIGTWRLERDDGHHPVYWFGLLTRSAYLACYCLPWVLAALAIWKAGTRETVRVGYRRDVGVSRQYLRMLGVCWLFTPLLINDPWDHVNEGCFWLLSLAAPLSMLFFLRMKFIARRAERAMLEGQCDVLAWLTGFASLAYLFVSRALLSGRSQWWADEVFSAAPWPGAGMLWGVHRLATELLRNTNQLIWFVPLLIPIALVLWDGLVLVKIARVARNGEAVTLTPDHAFQKSH